MPSPQFARNGVLSALLLGVIFVAANLYFSGTSHGTLANMFFAFAIVCELALVVFAALWLFAKAWLSEPERPPGPMPGGAGAPKPGAVPAIKLSLPGVASDQKPHPPAA